MKNAFKKTGTLVILLVFCFSCKKDSTSIYPDEIIGRWQAISGVPESSFKPCDFNETLTFYPDKSFLEVDGCDYTVSNGVWKIVDDILTVSNNDFPIPIDMTIISLSKSSLTLKILGITTNYKRSTTISSCKTCQQNAYDSVGKLLEEGTKKEYCDDLLIQIEATPDVTILNTTTRWVCN